MHVTFVRVAVGGGLGDQTGGGRDAVRERRGEQGSGAGDYGDVQACFLARLADGGLGGGLIVFHVPARRQPAVQARMPDQGH
ncbi:MAG: hypothetical protein ACRDNW_00040 [Trebonia sp.]